MAKKKKRKKRVNRKKRGKGSKFEREISKILSLWWTKGKREDVYWRSTTSGARATVRNRKGKGTFGQCGDIQANDPIGQPLLDVCNIELKRGYSRDTISHLLDSLPGNKPQAYELFIEQAKEDHKKAGSHFWLLIVKRDRRRPMVYMSIRFYRELSKALFPASETLTSGNEPSVKLKFKKKTIFGCPLSEFLSVIKPKIIKRVLKNLQCES